MTIHVGITGQSGFIGYHLCQTLNLHRTEFTLVPFLDEFFDRPADLAAFAASCDVIVHLAGVNRHADPDTLEATNVALTRRLIEAMESTGSRPHVLFASSVQEERDNPYGRSKRACRMLLAGWAERTGASFTGMLIPNVFGPFGRPFYNSVISTFSHQLARGETPHIDVDATLNLIAVDELVAWIRQRIHNTGAGTLCAEAPVAATARAGVSELLEILSGFRDGYLLQSTIPPLGTPFLVRLFNTFRSYIDPADRNPVRYVRHADHRGAYTELMRAGCGGQTSFSVTLPGLTRGDHFHTRKIERFSVISGEALIRLRRVGTPDTMEFRLTGNEPSFVDMPVWYTHSITNTGSTDLLTVFWINEFYDPGDPDTYPDTV